MGMTKRQEMKTLNAITMTLVRIEDDAFLTVVLMASKFWFDWSSFYSYKSSYAWSS